MISPAQHHIVQIDITNACPKRCSSCTRFVGHIRRPFVMDFETFQRAVRSMEGHPGLLGIMGGEPTIHPDFERMIHWYADHWGRPSRAAHGRLPIGDFGGYAQQRLYDQSSRRGLWTSLGAGYYKHFELIQEVFDYQCINTHENPGMHQSLLMTRRELGIPDDEWYPRRDACWVQNLWSSSITPKGAFFCEVAAALDMLYDGPGGWPIEPGWWKRTPADFGEQLAWCELCSAALDVPRVRADQQVELVSPVHAEKLARIQAPSAVQGRLRVFDVGGYSADQWRCAPGVDWYLEDESHRVPAEHVSLHPRRLDGVLVSVDCGEVLRHTLPYNRGLFERIVVVTTSRDTLTQEIARQHGAELVISDRCYDGGDAFNKGKMLNDGLAALGKADWVLLTDADVFLPQGLRGYLRRVVLNPGCLYYTRRRHLPAADEATLSAFAQGRLPLTGLPCESGVDDQVSGYFQLFNPLARVLRDRWPRLLSEEIPSAAGIDSWLTFLWPPDKRIPLAPDSAGLEVAHVPHGELGARWNGCRPGGIEGWRFGGWISPQGLCVVHPWPADGRLKLVGVSLSGSCEMPAAELGGRVALDQGGLVVNGQAIGQRLLLVAWRPAEAPAGPLAGWQSSVVVWPGGIAPGEA